MAGNVKINKKGAADMVMEDRRDDIPDEVINYETAAEDMEDLASFLQSHKEDLSKKASATKPFFKVNGVQIYGSNKSYIAAGSIPVFKGAALDLTNALMIGEKKWFKDPKASGQGAMLALFPNKINGAIMVPVNQLTLSETEITGETTVKKSGFGKFNRIVPSGIEIHEDKVLLKDVSVTQKQNEERISEIEVTEDGMTSSELDSEGWAKVANYVPPPPEIPTAQDTPATTPEAPTTQDVNLPSDVGTVSTTETTTEEPPPVVVDSTVEKVEINVGIYDKSNKLLEKYEQMIIKENGDDVSITLSSGDGESLEIENVSRKEDGSYFGETLTLNVVKKMEARFSNLEIRGNAIFAEKAKWIWNMSEGFGEDEADSGIDDDIDFANGGHNEDAQDELSSLAMNYLESKIRGSSGGKFVEEKTNAVLKYLGFNEIEPSEAEEKSLKDTLKEMKDAAELSNILGTIKSMGQHELDSGAFTGGDTTTYDSLVGLWDKYDTEENDESGGSTSVDGKAEYNLSVPMVPFVNFNLGVFAAYGAKYTPIKADLQGLSANLSDKRLEQSEEDGLGIKLNMEAAAKVTAGIKAGISVGLDALLNVEAFLQAALSLSGALQGIAKGNVRVKPNKTVDIEKLQLGLHGDMDLSASLSAGINLNVLIWSKELYRIDLAKKSILSFGADINGVKEGLGQPWKINSGASYESMIGGAKKAIDSDKQATLEALLEKSDVNQMAVEGSQKKYEELIGQLDKMHQMFDDYSNTSQPVILDVGKESFFLTFTEQVKELEEGFALQLHNNATIMTNCAMRIKHLKEDGAYALALKKEKFFQGNLDKITQLKADATDPKKRKDAVKELQNLRTSSNNDKLMETRFTDKNIEADAAERGKTPEALIKYEEEREKKYQKGGQKRIDNLKTQYKSLETELKSKGETIDENTKRAEIYRIYLDINKRSKGNVKSNYLKIFGADGLAQFAQKRFDEGESKKSEELKHIGRIAKLKEHYERLSSSNQHHDINKVFYDNYNKADGKWLEDHFNKGVVKQLTIRELENKHLRAFLQSYLGKKSSYQENKDKFRDASAYIDRIHELSAVENPTEKQTADLQEAKTKLDEIKSKENYKGSHTSASKSDYETVLKRQAIVKGLKERADGLGGDTKAKDVMTDDMVARGDILDRLIEFETNNVNRKEVLEKLRKAKADFTTGTGSAMKRTGDLQEVVRWYLEQKNSITGFGQTRASSIYEDMGENLTTSGIYNDDDVEQFEGKGSDLSVYQMMHAFGGKDYKGDTVKVKDRHKLVRQVIEARGEREDDILNHFRYKMEQKDSSLLSALSDKKGKDKDTAMYMQDLMDRENPSYEKMLHNFAGHDKLEEEYLKYIKDNAYLYLTPARLMAHEMGQIEHYGADREIKNVEKFRRGEIDLAELEKDKHYKKFIESTIANEDGAPQIKMSYAEVEAMEVAQMQLESAKHTKRLEGLRSGKTDSTNYVGQRMKAGDDVVKAITKKLSADPEYLADKMTENNSNQLASATATITNVDDTIRKLEESNDKLMSESNRCVNILADVDGAIADPKKFLKSSMKHYVDNVLGGLQQQANVTRENEEAAKLKKQADAQIAAEAAAQEAQAAQAAQGEQPAQGEQLTQERLV